MNVKDIEDLLEKVSPDSELVHIWIKPLGEPTTEGRDYETTLYFDDNGVKSQLSLRHFYKYRNKDESRGAPVLEESVGNKLKRIFNKGSSDEISSSL